MKEDIAELKEIFDDLKKTAGTTGKMAILKKQANNELFMQVIQFVYDDYVRTGVSFKTLNKNIDSTTISDYQGTFNLVSLMKYVKEHNTGTLSTIDLIQDFASLFPEDMKMFIYHIFAKDLKVGITAKTINKVFGKGFIKQFSVQLAHPYHKYPDKVVGKKFVLTQKLDGHRAICIVDNEGGRFFTRKGLPIPGLQKQVNEAQEFIWNSCDSVPYVLDGELLLSPEINAGMETKDLFRATSRILRSDTADKSDIVYNVFDWLPLDQFLNGESVKPFIERKDGLAKSFSYLYGIKDANGNSSIKYPDHLKLVENLYVGSDISAIKRLQQRYVEPLGWEGLMLNLADGKYQTKRTTNLLKIKEFFDADVPVIDIFEGSGRLQGTLGGVVVDYKGYPIRVGSGFTQKDRDYFWASPDAVLGKIVQISYFEETHNQNNNDISLRFPTYICQRPEKTLNDVSYEV